MNQGEWWNLRIVCMPQCLNGPKPPDQVQLLDTTRRFRSLHRGDSMVCLYLQAYKTLTKQVQNLNTVQVSSSIRTIKHQIPQISNPSGLSPINYQSPQVSELSSMMSWQKILVSENSIQSCKCERSHSSSSSIQSLRFLPVLTSENTVHTQCNGFITYCRHPSCNINIMWYLKAEVCRF